jgi:hypothetical protein
MKRVIYILVLQGFVNTIAMEQPAAVPQLPADQQSPAQIVQEARKRIILEGPDAHLHKLNSFLWAYMLPRHMEFEEQAVKFSHYKYEFIKYTMSWEDAHKRLDECRQEVEQNKKSFNMPVLYAKLISHGPGYALTPLEKLSLVKILLDQFIKNEGNATVMQRCNRSEYCTAFAQKNPLRLFNISKKNINELDCSFTDAIQIIKMQVFTEYAALKAEKKAEKKAENNSRCTLI